MASTSSSRSPPWATAAPSSRTSHAGSPSSSARCWRSASTSPCTRPRMFPPSWRPAGDGRRPGARGRPRCPLRRRLAAARWPLGARIGTSSLRRAAQLRALRHELEIVPLRGNVDTRLRKLAEGEVEAIVLAAPAWTACRADEAGAGARRSGPRGGPGGAGHPGPRGRDRPAARWPPSATPRRRPPWPPSGSSCTRWARPATRRWAPTRAPRRTASSS